MTKVHRSLIILDSLRDTYDGMGSFYTWNGYSETDSVTSILKAVDKSGDSLRQKYLEFIYDLGEYKPNGKKIRNALEMSEGPSLWWMSLLAEKSPFKSPRIIDSIRILALEEIILTEEPKELILSVNDKNVADAVKNLCKELNVKFTWKYKEIQYFHLSSLPDFILCISNILKGITYLAYYFFTRWTFNTRHNEKRATGKDAVFFSSYFFNLDAELIKEGAYYSRQWGDLPEFLSKNGVKTYHLENFIKSPEIPTTKIAKRILESFNKNNSNQSYHSFLDSYLSFKMLLHIFSQWCKLNLISLNLRNSKQGFALKNSKVNLWPLLKNDWFCSLHGKTAMANLIWISLFEKNMKELSFQKVGFYLCENQGWERAFIKAWRNHGHGKLIAVPHSTVRFWDLRYFFGSQLSLSHSRFSLPYPDRIAVNGKMAWDSFIKNNYPQGILCKSEALRYQYLTQKEQMKLKNKTNLSKEGKGKKNILVLGDFTEHQTDMMLKDLEIAVEKFNLYAEFTFKPHPVCRINLSSYPSLNLKKIIAPLQDVVKNFDIVFSSNTTTAGLDCFLMGKPVVVFLDGKNLNFSPLRNVEDIHFVSNPEELSKALNFERYVLKKEDKNVFFWLDPEMKKWKKIISEITS